MAPPQFGDEQVNCGPDWKDEKDAQGRYISLATPAGIYDLAAVASKLPPEQAPDLVVCLVDASWRNLPRNLAAFKCPRVVLVGDTGHMQFPLVRMMQYLAAEPFNRIVLPYDRHHASIFRTAGFQWLHWFPGVTFPHSDAVVKAARGSRRQPVLAFTGQLGKYHPRRCRLVEALKKAGLPLSVKPISQAEALRFYGSSLCGFNASLNGGVNLRVFEILAAGGALLTDRIAPAAGLDQILKEGQERVSYTGAEDLVEKALALMGEPRQAAAVGSAGAAWFDRTMNEERRRTAFHALAFDGRDLPEFEFSAAEKGRRLFDGSLPRLVQAVSVYEGVQELHRVKETVRIGLDSSVPADFASLCLTLPRAEIAGADDRGQLDYIGIPKSRAVSAAESSDSTRLWCWDAEPADAAGLQAELGAAGFICRSQVPAVFERIPQAFLSPKPSDCPAASVAAAVPA
jgi:hypothetical protein